MNRDLNRIHVRLGNSECTLCNYSTVADLSSLSNLDSNVTIFLAVTTDSGKLFQVSTDQYINEYLLMFSLGQILKIL